MHVMYPEMTDRKDPDAVMLTDQDERKLDHLVDKSEPE